MTKKKRIKKAIKIATMYGQIDGDHHKAWVIDQMLRVLAGEEYEKIIAEYCDGEDGTQTYRWYIGIAP